MAQKIISLQTTAQPYYGSRDEFFKHKFLSKENLPKERKIVFQEIL